MILDSQEQKELLLQIFNSLNISAVVIEKMYELKKAIEHSEIKGEK